MAAVALAIGLSAAPYARAHLRPPPGRAFVGAFLFIEDTYNYLGYVQQAQEGAFLFRSRLTAERHAPVLVNLEWWAAGVLARALGRRPLLAWRILGLAAAIPFVLLAEAWLRRVGLPAAHRLAALLLVCGGAGLGGCISLLGLARATPLDLGTGLFAVMELLANPHFVVGTSLTMASLLALSQGSRRGTIAGVTLAALAGLTRPYDLVLIVAARGLAAAAGQPPRRWLRAVLPLAALLPVVAYDYGVFHRSRDFAVFLSSRFPPPPLLPVLVALAPALALAATSLRASGDGAQRRARTHLWCWAAVALVAIVARPVPYALQFLAGVGVPLLALAAMGLARWRPRATWLVLALLSSTPAVALWRMGRDDPRWFVPAPRLDAARAMGPVCRAGDVALAPVDIGLYSLAFSSCVPFVSHPAMSGYEARLEETRAFYGRWDGTARAAFLQQQCVAVLVLPREEAPDPAAWARVTASFQPARVADGYAIYRRAAACGAP